MADPIYPLGINSLDPLRHITAGKDQELCNKLSQVCGSCSTDVVISATANLLIRALRQAYPKKGMAEAAASELFSKIIVLLSSHYDSTTGKRREVFPFTQHVHAAHFNDKDKTRK